MTCLYWAHIVYMTIITCDFWSIKILDVYLKNNADRSKVLTYISWVIAKDIVAYLKHEGNVTLSVISC